MGDNGAFEHWKCRFRFHHHGIIQKRSKRGDYFDCDDCSAHSTVVPHPGDDGCHSEAKSLDFDSRRAGKPCVLAALHDHFRGRTRTTTARSHMVMLCHYITNPVLVSLLFLYVNSNATVTGAPVSKRFR